MLVQTRHRSSSEKNMILYVNVSPKKKLFEEQKSKQKANVLLQGSVTVIFPHRFSAGWDSHGHPYLLDTHDSATTCLTD